MHPGERAPRSGRERRVVRAIARIASAALASVMVTDAAARGPVSAQAVPSPPAPVAASLDPHVERSRVLVMTDVANEPDDQTSFSWSSRHGIGHTHGGRVTPTI